MSVQGRLCTRTDPEARRQTLVDKMAYTIPEMCNRAGISRSTAYLEIRAGRLVAVKSGRRTLIRHDDLVRWLEELPAMR